MIQIQITIDVPGDNKNRIQLDILEREDANDPEREMAGNIEELFKSIFGQIRDQLGDDEVTITEIR